MPRPFALLATLFLAPAFLPPAQAGEIGTAAVEIPATVAIPFSHRVGDRWRIHVERREDRAGARGPNVTSEAEAELLSLYGRDFLVDLRWLSATEGGRTVSLVERTAENARPLDLRGGGRLSLRVDRQGTAVDVLNAAEVRSALARVRGSAVTDAAWPAERETLLEVWNTVYRACGVPVTPEVEVVTPLRDAQAREVGRDQRRLRLEEQQGRQPVLALAADTAVGDPKGEGDLWREVFSVRFDPVPRRLSGTSTIDRRVSGRLSRVRLTFREETVPVPAQPALLAAAIPASVSAAALPAR